MKNTPGILVAALVFVVADSAPVGAIEELVVTAQKREQNIRDVSISVTAFSGDRVEALGFEQPIDIATQIPNFHVKNEVGKATPTLTIRGVGLGAFSHNSVSPVAVYVDEVFMPSTTQMSFSLFDLERVEVLKGPQGDLFGRNTTAGSVSFVSRNPRRNLTRGQMSAWAVMRPLLSMRQSAAEYPIPYRFVWRVNGITRPKGSMTIP